jgi:hypothetical protein
MQVDFFSKETTLLEFKNHKHLTKQNKTKPDSYSRETGERLPGDHRSGGAITSASGREKNVELL